MAVEDKPTWLHEYNNAIMGEDFLKRNNIDLTKDTLIKTTKHLENGFLYIYDLTHVHPHEHNWELGYKPYKGDAIKYKCHHLKSIRDLEDQRNGLHQWAKDKGYD